MAIKIFADVETTGTDYRKHSIHQLAGMVEVDGEVVEKFNIKMRPHPKARIEKEALHVAGVAIDEIMAYQPMERAHKEFVALLGKYINKFDKSSKAFMVGFNNRAFDDFFIRIWFELCDDLFYMSWFYPDSLDVMVLASEYLLDRRSEMPSFKLKRVAMELGIEVDKESLHDAYYDVEITRQIYRIVTGREIEM